MWQDTVDEAIKKVWPGAPPSVLTAIHQKLASWITAEESEYADIIFDALNDKSPGVPTLAKLLAAVLRNRVKGTTTISVLAQQLLGDLDDGKITTQELVEVAAVWANGHVTSPDLQSFIELATTLPFEDGDIKQGILDWVKDRAGSALSADLADAIDNRKALNTRDLALFLISAFSQSNILKTNKLDASGIKAALLDALNTAASTSKAGPIIGILKNFLADQPAQAILGVVKLFGFTGDDSFVEAILGIGDLKAEILKRLAGILVTLNVPQDAAEALVERFFAIADGSDPLFAQDELQGILLYEQTHDHFSLNAEGYELWSKFRRVLFAAKMALNGGSVVPTDAMARPYVFAIVDIDWQTTKLGSLAGDKVSLFCTLVTEFANVEFSSFGKDLTDPALIVSSLIKHDNPLASKFFKEVLLSRLS